MNNAIYIQINQESLNSNPTALVSHFFMCPHNFGSRCRVAWLAQIHGSLA
jgi:hypothetical protein